MAKKDTKLRARQQILHYVLSFCVSRRYDGDTRLYPGIEGFHSEMSRAAVQVGDLVILKSAPASKWTIGWLRAIREHPHDREYCIESLDDGDLCWWSNVGIEYFPRDKIDESWRWTDRQHAFNDRWRRVCFKERDAYIYLPLYAEFGEGYAVTLGTRVRFGFDAKQCRRSFPDWRKVTRKMMAECYDDCVAEHERVAEAAKAEREAAAASAEN